MIFGDVYLRVVLIGKVIIGGHVLGDCGNRCRVHGCVVLGVMNLGVLFVVPSEYWLSTVAV